MSEGSKEATRIVLITSGGCGGGRSQGGAASDTSAVTPSLDLLVTHSRTFRNGLFTRDSLRTVSARRLRHHLPLCSSPRMVAPQPSGSAARPSHLRVTAVLASITVPIPCQQPHHHHLLPFRYNSQHACTNCCIPRSSGTSNRPTRLSDRSTTTWHAHDMLNFFFGSFDK